MRMGGGNEVRMHAERGAECHTHMSAAGEAAIPNERERISSGSGGGSIRGCRIHGSEGRRMMRESGSQGHGGWSGWADQLR